MSLVKNFELKFMYLSNMDVLQEQKNGTIISNLKGVALGDAWISPIDSVLTWAWYLLSTVNIRLFIAMHLHDETAIFIDEINIFHD